MKVLFLCGVFDENNNEEIIKNSRHAVEYSANVFQEKLIEGINFCAIDAQLISAPFIGPYPNAYRKIWFSGFSDKSSKYKYVNFCNIWGLRNFSRYMALKKELKSFIELDDPDKIIIVYSVHTPLLRAAVYAKSKDPRIKINLIVLDLPQYMNLNKHQSVIYRIGKKYDIKQFEKYNKYVDSYVLLTEHMTEKLDIHARPYMVLEGIVRKSDLTDFKHYVSQNSVKNILYAGKLNKKFGVKNLIDAFELIESPNVRLILCGKGDLEDYVIKMAGKDKRVIYKGQVTPNEVKELIELSDILVNPRPNNELYTRYSFPSKNIEYLLSGRPVVGYKLDGMPDLYKSFIITVKEDAAVTPVENLHRALESALAIDTYDNQLFIKYAKENLSAEVAIGKMIELTKERV